MIIIITSHLKEVWDGGDSVITEGVKTLLPQLRGKALVFSKQITDADTESYVKDAEYIIHAGTPSWLTYDNRRFWKACAKHKKPIAMFGIGLALHYSSEMWYGSEDFIHLRDSGLIDQIVCRDKYCYYWLHQRLGFDSSKIDILPCPAFYTLPPRIRTAKKEVVFSLANVEETSHQTETTFRNYYNKCGSVIHELRAAGAIVHLIYQRNIETEEFAHCKDMIEGRFPHEKIHHFTNQKQFQEFLADKDVYIGIRNHGALPCGGSGMPALLLGTDYRQSLADEIPFISKIDISYFDWKPRMVLDWYHALDVESISRSLINYRQITYRRWDDLTHTLRMKLSPPILASAKIAIRGAAGVSNIKSSVKTAERCEEIKH